MKFSKILFALAQWYLVVVGASYTIAGLLALTLVWPAVFFSLFLVIPQSLLFSNEMDSSFIPQPSFLLPYLGVLAIILGIISIYSLMKIKNSILWIYIWYGLSALAYILSTIDLIIEINQPFGRIDEFTILNFINSTLFLIATMLVHRKYKIQNVAVSAIISAP